MSVPNDYDPAVVCLVSVDGLHHPTLEQIQIDNVCVGHSICNSCSLAINGRYSVDNDPLGPWVSVQPEVPPLPVEG